MSAVDISNLVDIESEKSLLLSLCECGFEEADVAVSKIRKEIFFASQHQEIYDVLNNLIDRNFTPTLELVRSEMLSLGLNTDPLMQIAICEPCASIDWSIDKLMEWSSKRKLYKAMQKGFEIISSSTSGAIGNMLSMEIENMDIETSVRFKSYAEVKKEISILSEVEKVVSGVSFIDTKLKGGIERGQLILLMGDPDSGKTVLATQILKNVSNKYKTLFFPFEFKSRAFVEKNINNEHKFNLHNFLMGGESNDILDIKQDIKAFAKKGGVFVTIDSQMMVTNIANKGSTQERETEKFFILMNLAIKYNLVIIFICQQGKDDARTSTINPMGTKNGAHAAHQIWYIKTPKPDFDKRGGQTNKNERDFILHKNKQNGIAYSKPILLDSTNLEFSGRHYDATDPRSKNYGKPMCEIKYMKDSEYQAQKLDLPPI